jgi:hypothetical protein
VADRISASPFSSSTPLASFKYTDAKPAVDPVEEEFFNILLGHTQPNTTARYAHVSRDSLRAALAWLASPSKPVALLESDDADAA